MTLPWYILNGFLIFQMAFFTCLNLKPKFNKYLTFFIIFIPVVTGAFMVNRFNNISQTIFAVAPMLWYIISSFLLFKDKLVKRLFVIILIICGQYLVALFGESIIHFLGLEETDPEGMAVLFISCVFLFLAYSALTFYRKKKINPDTVMPNMAVFIVFPFSQMIVIFSCIFVFGADKVLEAKPLALFGTSKNIVWLFLTFGAVFCVIADIAMFFVMKHTAQNERLREELLFRDYQDKLSLNYYRSLAKSAAETRKIKHDLNNILQMSYALFKSGDSLELEDSQNMLRSLKESVDKLNVEKFSDNKLINIIVSNKAADCKSNGIRLNSDITVGESVGIEDMDLCRAYTNLLDNAFNALIKCDEKDRILEVESRLDGDMLFIKTKNKIPPHEEEKPEKTDGHGNGLVILHDIAEKYNGSFMTKEEDEMFTALLALKTRSS